MLWAGLLLEVFPDSDTGGWDGLENPKLAHVLSWVDQAEAPRFEHQAFDNLQHDLGKEQSHEHGHGIRMIIIIDHFQKPSLKSSAPG